MHDNIAGIDQHPISLRQPVDGPRSIAGFFQPSRQMLGNRSNMAAGASIGDDKRVG